VKSRVSIVLVGIGGYGTTYVRALLKHQGRGDFCITGIVDPNPQGCAHYDELREMGIPVYSNLRDFYSERGADLAVIASPIQFHHEQCLLALAKGSHVLCEKPVSARIQDALEMLEAEQRAGKILAIGYQWSYSQAIQELKSDILQGKWGRPRRLKTVVLWPRDAKYFQRPWAGKKRDTAGRWVLDSVANNATSHYLHNMLYVLGEEIHTATRPKYIEGQLYVANKIENFDTAMLRIITDDDVELLFYATHAVKHSLEPTFLYEFTGGTISYGQRDDGTHQPRIVGISQDGVTRDYGNPNTDRVRHLWLLIDSIIQGKKPDICGARAASSHTLCINGIQEAFGAIPRFPKEFINYDSETKITWMDGLDQVITTAYDNWRLPTKEDAVWVRDSQGWTLSGYTYFHGDI
jgi:predicted dehydrogenase